MARNQDEMGARSQGGLKKFWSVKGRGSNTKGNDGMGALLDGHAHGARPNQIGAVLLDQIDDHVQHIVTHRDGFGVGGVIGLIDEHGDHFTGDVNVGSFDGAAEDRSR